MVPRGGSRVEPLATGQTAIIAPLASSGPCCPCPARPCRLAVVAVLGTLVVSAAQAAA